MILFVVFYFFLFQASSSASCASESLSSVIVQTYDELSCAVYSGIPNIFVNDTIEFEGTINVGNSKSIAIGGLGSISLIGKVGYTMFNTSASSILGIEDLTVIGTDSYNQAGIAIVVDSELRISNSTIKNGIGLCTGGVFAVNSRLKIWDSQLSNNTVLSTSTPQCGGGALSIYSTEAQITNSKFRKNYGSTGGAISVKFGNVTAMNSVLSYNEASSYGGALYISSANVTAEKLQCYGNYAVSGGCLYSSASNVEISNGTIFSNMATNGGGMYISADSDVMVLALQLESNTAAASGGGSYCVASSLLMEESTVGYNGASVTGGGLAAVTGCRMSLRSLLMQSNGVSGADEPISYGGCLYAVHANVSLAGSTLHQCSAQTGSIAFSFQSYLTISDTDFNHAVHDDSGIYAGEGTQLSLSRATFFNNSAILSTGVVTCSESHSCVIADSMFLNNSGLDYGMVFAQYATLNMSNTTFRNNQIGGSGGALYLAVNADSSFYNCIFDSNRAGVFGGAVFVEITTVLVDVGSNFTNNRAVSGGAIYAFNEVELNLDSSVFSGNTAYDSGGSVFLEDFSSLIGDSLQFFQSSAPHGGAVYATYMSSVSLNNIVAIGNTGGFAGGVLALFNNATATVKNSELTGNSAALGGVVAAQYYAQYHFKKCTFTNNSVLEYGGVGYTLVQSTGVMTDCVMSGNYADFGGGGFEVETSTLSINSCTLIGNSASVGGVLNIIAGTATMSDSSFINNGVLSDTVNGGVAYLSSHSVLSTTSCNFTSNQVRALAASLKTNLSQAQYGGAVSVTSSDYFSSADLFQYCKGKYGGCISGALNSSCTLDSSTLQYNYAPSYDASVIYFVESYLTMQSATVQHNTAHTKGAVSLFSVTTTIDNCTFADNVMTTTGATGSALFLTVTTDNSDIGVYSATISNSRFSGNYAYGAGGAVYIGDYPGVVTVSNCVFVSNGAINGGAIGAAATVVDISSSTFQGNTAAQGGGAIYWTYEAGFITTVADSCISINNSASYGDFKATDLVTLNATSSTVAGENSGKVLIDPIEVYLLDYYGQPVRNTTLQNSKENTIYCSVYNNSGTVKGGTIVTAVSGVAVFDELVVTGYPGGSTTLLFEVSVSTISNVFLTLYFRNCVPGEIFKSAGTDQATCDECGLGTYSFFTTDTECNVCPENCYCPGGNQLDVNSGYWRADDTSATILQCSVPGVCLGGNDTATQCAEGQTGPYCDVCMEGWTMNQVGVCYNCDNGISLVTETISTIIFALVVIFLLVFFRYRKKIMRWYREKMKAITENKKYRTLKVKLKIVVAFVQILFQMGTALDVVFPAVYGRFLNYYSIFDLNIVGLPGVNCLLKANFYDGLLVTTISPFILFLIVVIVLQFVVIRAKRINERHPSYTAQKATRDTVAAAFLISYFVLVNASTKIFQVFQCEDFDNGESRLVADFSIDCNASDRSKWVYYGIFMIFVYPVGIPLVYSVVLFKNRRLINPDWRLVVDGKEKGLVSNKVIQNAKIKIRNTYDELKNITYLYDNYVPKRWYFELFECARRLLLGAVPVLIIRGTLMQVIIVLLISLASVAVFMNFNPYIHMADNQLAVMAQWSITLVIISSIIIKVQELGDTGGYSTALGIILILLNMSVITFSVGAAVISAKPKSELSKGEGGAGEGGSDEEMDEEDDAEEDLDSDEDSREKERKQSVGGSTDGSGVAIEMNPLHHQKKKPRTIGRKDSVNKKKRSVRKKKSVFQERDSDDEDFEDDGGANRTSVDKRNSLEV